ncbi:MAG: 30S ribosomal protein S5 alanine N-acetyltransferase, partial [Xanthobacteraceae bacterium]|nr:30S ribosomal protein S5 alanine N-acetyltransferase [Xanthobacteraceae bacterium]
MALFKSVLWSAPLPVIEGRGVFLRVPQMADWSEWSRLRGDSRAFLTPWEPLWPADDLSRGAFRRRMRRYVREMRADIGYPFL